MVLMPMTSPCQFMSGPPELPGLMAASVWIASSMRGPSGSCTGRIELTMPRVIVPESPKGLPIAYTFCPTCRSRESPRTAGTRSGALIWMTARSCARSLPTMVARYFLRLCVVNHVIVGQDVAFLVDDKPGSLAFLRNQSVKEIEGDGFRRDVDHRGNIR